MFKLIKFAFIAALVFVTFPCFAGATEEEAELIRIFNPIFSNFSELSSETRRTSIKITDYEKAEKTQLDKTGVMRLLASKFKEWGPEGANAQCVSDTVDSITANYMKQWTPYDKLFSTTATPGTGTLECKRETA
jgi:hypothetical protein